MTIEATRRELLKGLLAVASIAALGGASGVFKIDTYYMSDGETLDGVTFDDYVKIILSNNCTVINCVFPNCGIEGTNVENVVIKNSVFKTAPHVMLLRGKTLRNLTCAPAIAIAYS